MVGLIIAFENHPPAILKQNFIQLAIVLVDTLVEKPSELRART